MIVGMSKIAVIGPKETRLDVLDHLQEQGILEIEPDIASVSPTLDIGRLKSLPQDGQRLTEMLFLRSLLEKVEELLDTLPKVESRQTYFDPAKLVTAISELVDRHDSACRQMSQQSDLLQARRQELAEQLELLDQISPLVEDIGADSSLAFFAIGLKDPMALHSLHEVVSRATNGHFEMETIEGKDGSLISLITADEGRADDLKALLTDERLPELPLPGRLGSLPLKEQKELCHRRIEQLQAEQLQQSAKLNAFARQWVPIYSAIRSWLKDHLSLLSIDSSVYETEYCFFLMGWLPSSELPALRQSLQKRFGEQLTVEEKEILDSDLDLIPVELSNPAYFKPFEIFSRLLPLPKYGSFDSTPFIGIFFPLFFGIMLGDIGYGSILLAIALALILSVKEHPLVVDAAKVLGVAALYTVLFGFLFGECFGDLGHRLFGLEPLCFERRESIIPMFLFTLALGVAHICLGLFLGFLSALKRGMAKVALFKLLSVATLLIMVLYGASFFPTGAALARPPLLAAIAIAVPLLLITGGLLAPLEMIKNIGNIISYVRIMAIGLTSVMLAYVANQLAGASGSVLLGIIVAMLLHGFNILLGVFAPTVHSLRLHFVEFFSKFIETGGRPFKPISK